NTYIIFTSDHGLAVGQHGLIGKQSLYDHSIRVPMIISGPNIKKGSWYNQDIYLQDIVPTSLDLANIEVSSEMDFNSFKEILFDESSDQINNGIYGTYGCCPGNYFNYQRIIRKDGFKLMFFPKNQRIELYNVEDDPFEINNLAGDENYYEKILSLGNDFVELQKNYNDTLNIKKIFKNIWKDSKS
ncbi:MAG: sulfatase/phosphatase domain-containing protein, partial [Flavobacteriaceae bacterium]